MSWLFSQALVEEFSAATCSDGEPYAQLNVMPTPHKFWRNDKTMEFSSLSRFGLTCQLLTESRGEELLTWFLAGFRARTSAQQEGALESTECVVGYGGRCGELLARFDPNTHTWKTAQSSLLGDSGGYSVTWPRWGTMRNGVAYQEKVSVPITRGSESGSLLPTPTCHNAKEGAYPAEYKRNTPTLATHVGGKIPPIFTEWLMGWPLGWTDLKPLETAKFQAWQQQHGGF